MLKRIILHWTAGRYYPTEFEKNYYHYLIDVEGNVIPGKYKPEDNIDCTDGCYAAHTGGGNTGSIGVSMCGMYGFVLNSFCGYYPIERRQFEACMKFMAELCKKYEIKVSPQTVLTHYEFGKAHPKTSSAGKVDIVYIPPYPWVARDDVGAFIRTKVRWYFEKL